MSEANGRKLEKSGPKTGIYKRKTCAYCGDKLPDERHSRQVYCNEKCKGGAAYQRRKKQARDQRLGY